MLMLVTVLLIILVAVIRLTVTPKAKPLPEKPPTSDILYMAKRQFIAAMNRRISREPANATQLQKLRDMVVGWYEVKGPVIGVRFVAKSCCTVCYRLDGSQISLLDIRYLTRHIPPLHRESDQKADCSCTLQPVTARQAARAKEQRAVRNTRPLSAR